MWTKFKDKTPPSGGYFLRHYESQDKMVGFFDSVKGRLETSFSSFGEWVGYELNTLEWFDESHETTPRNSIIERIDKVYRQYEDVGIYDDDSFHKALIGEFSQDTHPETTHLTAEWLMENGKRWGLVEGGKGDYDFVTTKLFTYKYNLIVDFSVTTTGVSRVLVEIGWYVKDYSKIFESLSVQEFLTLLKLFEIEEIAQQIWELYPECNSSAC